MTTGEKERAQAAQASPREAGEAGSAIEHPLLLAALMGRREGGDGLIEHPLLLAAMMGRD